MQDFQQIGDLHMALHINKLLYRQGRITIEMFSDAGRVFAQRLRDLENDLKSDLNKTV